MDQVTFDHGENGHAVEPLVKLATNGIENQSKINALRNPLVKCEQ